MFIHDLQFEKYIGHEAIAERVVQIGTQISADYQGKSVHVIVILKGAMMFAADLLRAMDLECEVSFMRLTSYEGTTSSGLVTQALKTESVLTSKHVIIVEDIVDTGLTLDFLLQNIEQEKPASLVLASLLRKEASKHRSIAYVGFELANDFVIGYGLDYKEKGRNLRDIYRKI